ncbi:MAG: hypothetical protein Q9220_000229 [cf. Caloplaca sp. 1 TL-2023]
MTRKKKAPSQPKRLQVTDSDGWTHIIHGLKNTHLSDTPKYKIRDRIQPAEIPEGQTLYDLQNYYAHYCSQWQSSTCCHAIQELLRMEILPSISPRVIKRCVVLGIGSFSEGRHSSWWELVFLKTVLELLQQQIGREKQGQGKEAAEEEAKMAVYLQDPVFNALDTAFLQSLGYVVLEHPAAFDEIDEATFVFAPHVEVDVYSEALEGVKGLPRMCIGTDLNICLES